MLIIGDKEVETSQFQSDQEKDGDLGAMNVDAFISKLMEEIRTRGKLNNTLKYYSGKLKRFCFNCKKRHYK